MPKETTKAGILGALQRFVTPLNANAGEIPHLDGSRSKLNTLLAQAFELSNQQGLLAASRQQVSKDLNTLLTEAQRLANVLRLALKEHYGIRSEKLSEYGLQPFRGRPRKEIFGGKKGKPAAAAPVPSEAPSPAPDSAE